MASGLEFLLSECQYPAPLFAMPLDDLFDDLEDFVEDIFEPVEDLMSSLLGKKSRKKLKRLSKSKKSGDSTAIATIGASAHQKWKEKGKGKANKKQDDKRVPSESAGEEVQVAAKNVNVTECLRMNMLLTMISAAGADGKIDHKELTLVQKAIDEASVSAKDKAMLTRMMNQPPPLEEIALGATSPLEACELYGAALSVIEEDSSPANTLFLRRFAVALKLDEDLVKTIEETLKSL